MLAITAELKRVLKKTGTMWWNHGDSYGTGSGAGTRMGSKQGTNRAFTDENLYYKETGKDSIPGYEKCLLLQNYRLIQRMIDEQRWILRNILIWHKPNCMPSSVKDRFTVDYEPVFFLTKSKRYLFEAQYEPVLTWDNSDRDRDNTKLNNTTGRTKMAGLKTNDYRESGRNKRCVWRIPTSPFKEAHFATFPPKLIEPMVLAGCPKGGLVLDPFMGAGTTAVVAKRLGRDYLGIELNPKYVEMAEQRIRGQAKPLI